MTPNLSERRRVEFPVSSGYLRIAALTLGLQERELPQLLAGTGLPVSILMPGDETYLSGEHLLCTLENGYRLMGGPGFGIALGNQLGPHAHGPIGYLSLASPDLMSSLRAFADYLPARIGLIELQIELGEEWLTLTCQFHKLPPEYLRQSICECFALAVQAQIEAILRRDAVEAEIDFPYSAPGYKALYAEALHGRYRFARAELCYRLPAALAHTPNTGGDSEAYRITRERCEKLLAQQANPAGSVAHQVRRLLLSQPQISVDEEKVARALYVSKRTLARRLAQERTNYRAIREEVLHDLACRALRDSRQTVESIAHSLGYNDSSAFRKAFRRWSGTTPQAFRAQMSQLGPYGDLGGPD